MTRLDPIATPRETRSAVLIEAPTSTRADAVALDERWRAVQGRDARADGRFVYAVTSTGIYCRPSCGARLPRPEHVVFFSSTDAAEHAGFRACKRCKPNGPALAEQHASIVADLCRMIEAADAPPTLAELAARAGSSVFHTQRLFKRVTGVTPKVYAAAHRSSRVREELLASASVTEAVYAAGYASPGAFYANVNATLGMTPRQFRAGGERVRIRFAVSHCTLGAILVAATERGVCAIALADDASMLMDELARRFPRAQVIAAEADLGELVARVIAAVERPDVASALPLDIRGTAFQQRVWQALMQIPAGTTTTYSELARTLGAPQATRAVARACAANALAVAVPCHRVVRSDGSLAGYRWGVQRKLELLAREQAATATQDETPARLRGR